MRQEGKASKHQESDVSNGALHFRHTVVNIMNIAIVHIILKRRVFYLFLAEKKQFLKNPELKTGIKIPALHFQYKILVYPV